MQEHIREEDWESLARNMLRAHLMQRGFSYVNLVEALAAIGVAETEAAIKNKVSRGRFSFVFFLQSMAAIDAQEIRLPSHDAILEGEGLGNAGAQMLARKSKADSA